MELMKKSMWVFDSWKFDKKIEPYNVMFAYYNIYIYIYIYIEKIS